MPHHRCISRHASRVLAPSQMLPSRCKRAAFSSSTMHRAAEDAESQQAAWNSQYQLLKLRLQAGADNALIHNRQDKRAWLRVTEEARLAIMSIPAEETGINIHLQKALLQDLDAADKADLEAEQQVLDMLSRDPYAMGSAEPLKEYTDLWSNRKPAEQQAEYRNVKGDIAALDGSMDSQEDGMKRLLEERYGTVAVRAAVQKLEERNARTDVVADFDDASVDTASELELSTDEPETPPAPRASLATLKEEPAPKTLAEQLASSQST